MGLSKSKERKLGSILSYGQMFLQIIIGIVYSPIMIRLLGQSEYGLYNTVSSTISMLSILSLGFNSSYVRFYSKYNGKNDKESIDKLNGLFLIIFIIIGVIGLICGLFVTFNLNLVFSDGLTAAEYETARVLMFLLTINLAVSFPMSVFSTIISAHERFVFLKLLGMIKTVITPILNIPLLLLGYGSIGLVVSSLVLAFITDILYLYYVLAVLKNKFIFHDFEKGLFKRLFNFTIFIAINLIVNEINVGLDKIILARYAGTISVAIYAVGASLYNYYKMFSTSVNGVFTPMIHKIQEKHITEKEKNDEFTNLFIRVGRIQFLILGLLLFGLILFAKEFIYYWVGSGYDDSYLVCIILAIPATIPLIQNTGIEIQRAKNKHQFRSIAYAIMAGVNLTLTIFLARVYGAVGAVIGTAISIVLANGFIMNIYYYKACGIDIPKFWLNIIKMLVGMIPAIIIGFLIDKFISITSIWILLLCILLFTISYVISVWFLSMNDYEKNLILTPLRKIIRKGA